MFGGGAGPPYNEYLKCEPCLDLSLKPSGSLNTEWVLSMPGPVGDVTDGKRRVRWSMHKVISEQGNGVLIS